MHFSILRSYVLTSLIPDSEPTGFIFLTSILAACYLMPFQSVREITGILFFRKLPLSSPKPRLSAPLEEPVNTHFLVAFHQF